jgi:rod shape-determining protein MreC
MKLLSKDRFSRGGFAAREGGPFTLRLPLLFFLSLALIALSRLDHPAIKELRAEAEAWIAPALGAAMLPLDPARRLIRQVQSSYDGFSELERMRGENQRLKQWESRAQALERKIAELAAMTKTLEASSIDYRTVRVIATSSGAFVHSALLEAGTVDGIRTGQPVISAGGVLGRIVEAGRRTSRLLLLNDINSRIPVLIGTAQTRAILAGDNTAQPRLLMLPQGTVIEPGEEVTTSGLGGMFPRGLRIGHTSSGTAGLRVDLDAGLADLEYVSVLMYDNPGTALTRELRPAAVEPPQRPRSPAAKEARP